MINRPTPKRFAKWNLTRPNTGNQHQVWRVNYLSAESDFYVAVLDCISLARDITPLSVSENDVADAVGQYLGAFPTANRWLTFEQLWERLTGLPEPPEPPSIDPKPMTYGFHKGDFLNPFFGPAQVGEPWDQVRQYFRALRDRGDDSVLLNSEQDPWFDREGTPQYGAALDYYNSSLDRERFLLALDAAWQDYGLRPHVGIIDQPTLRRLYWDDWPQILNMTTQLMEDIKGKASLAMPSWECGEVMSNGSRESHIMMEDRLVEWAALIHKIDPNAWVGIHHADGLRGGNLFYGRLGQLMGQKACRYMQYDQADTDSDLRHKTTLIRDVADRTGTSICIMEHSSPVRLGKTYPKHEADRRARVCATQLDRDNIRHWNFMNGW